MSERFFPPGTQYDAYIAIRDILEQASHSILIVDPYMGSTLFATLNAVGPDRLDHTLVQLLTTVKNLKRDFQLEASNFCQQYSTVALEVRTTADFHDRFIVIDGVHHYHVGASIKDAGNRAFLISLLEDEPIIAALSHQLLQTWRSATPIPIRA